MFSLPAPGPLTLPWQYSDLEGKGGGAMTGASQYLSTSQPSVPVPKAFLDPDPERAAAGRAPLRPGS